jgi:arabinose-5-phosphate isomerase
MTVARAKPPFDRLAFARQVLRAEAASIETVAGRLDASFERVVDRLAGCRGRIAVTGVGKSADVGQKLVGTFNSTGTRAYLLDAMRALHGDLGMVHPDDVALLFSHSGESEEIVRLLGPLRRLGSAITAVTGNAAGTLARAADAAIVYGPLTEACPLSLAPSSSTTVMLALGDAVAFTLLEQNQFTVEDFARYHPAGSLGRKLAAVDEYMRQGEELRIAPMSETVRTVFAQVRHQGRRTGAIMLVDAAGRLAGLFTDSDLARLFEQRADALLDAPIERVMTKQPVVIDRTARMSEALEILRARKISELPVVDGGGRPVGMLDITDLIGLEPPDTALQSRPVLKVADRMSA